MANAKFFASVFLMTVVKRKRGKVRSRKAATSRQKRGAEHRGADDHT